MAWYTGLSGFIAAPSGVIRLASRTSAERERGSYNEARETVNESSVLALSAAWACVNLVAGQIATLPVNVYRPVAVGRAIPTDRWLYSSLHDDPNADQTAVDFWEYMAASLELRGNAYALKLRGASDQVVGLDPIPPGIVSRTRGSDGEIEYRWTWNGTSYVETSHN